MNNRDVIIEILWILVLIHIAIIWALAIRRGWQARKTGAQVHKPPANDLPPVSIIVPAWNEKGTIEKNIAALRKVGYPNWEAIILAGGMDGTYTAAIQAAEGDDQIQVLERGPEPKNAAIKRGLQRAKNEIIVLLDCDNIVEPGWLTALISPIANGASVSVGDSRPNCDTWVTQEEQMWNIYTYEILKLSWIQGDRSIAIRRELLEKIGTLPEHTYAREDWDIWAKLTERGEKVAFAKGALLTTDRPSTVAESWKHQVRWRRTHLNGIWERRVSLLKQPIETFRQMYGYLVSAGLCMLALATVLVSIIHPATALFPINLLAMALVWLCARQAAVAGAVATYTGDWKWLARAWMPAINQFVTIPASLVAFLTSKKLSPLYKGPRQIVPTKTIKKR